MKKTLIVVALIVLGSLGYYAYQQKTKTATESKAVADSPTANVAYKNDEFGFSLEYPEYFTTYEVRKFDRADQKFATGFFEISQKKEDGTFKGFPKFSVVVAENSDKLQLEDWVSKHIATSLTYGKSEQKIGENNWLRFMESGEVDHWVYLIKNKNNVLLIYIPNIPNPMEFSIYEKLFSSFKIY